MFKINYCWSTPENSPNVAVHIGFWEAGVGDPIVGIRNPLDGIENPASS